MATNSNRSSGSQHNARGVTQGVTLVDPKTGLPVAVVLGDDGKYRLAVDANINASIGDINVDLDGTGPNGDSVYLVDNVTGNKFKINADGSIDVNVELDSSTDNVAIGDGTNIAEVTADKELKVTDTKTQDKLDDILSELQQKTEPSDTQQIAGTVSVSSLPLPPDAATETTLSQVASSVDQVESKLDSILTELQQKTEPSNAQNIRDLTSTSDSVSVPGVATATKQDEAKTILQSIDSKLTNPLPVSVPGGIAIGDLNASKDDVAIAGTENGLATGTVRHFVNNRRQQILAAHDRDQLILYADFGTKDQRITSIAYTSPTFPGITALKTITYTLVGNRYRRDNITWSIV